MKQKTITIIFFTSIILFGINVSSASAATYFMRADGTAPNKTAATGPSSDVSKCMSVAIHNSQTFVDGDIIKLSSKGGIYKITMRPPSSGTLIGIKYTSETTETPEFDLSISVTNWTNLGDGRYTKSNSRAEMFFEDNAIIRRASSSSLTDGYWYQDRSDNGTLYYKPTSGVPTDHITERVSAAFNNGTAFYTLSKSYITIENMRIKKAWAGIFSYNQNDYSHVTVQNCAFDSCYHAIGGQLVNDKIASDIQILNNTISYCAQGIVHYFESGGFNVGYTPKYRNVTVSGNRVDHNGFASDAPVYWDNIVFNTDMEAISFQDPQSCTIEHNIVTNGHHYGIFLYGSDSGITKLTNNIVRKNYVNTDNIGLYFAWSQPFGGASGNRWEYNIVDRSGMGGQGPGTAVLMGSRNNPETGTNYFSNNVIYQGDYRGLHLPHNTSGTWEIKNNIFDGKSWHIYKDFAGPSNYTLDYNLYTSDGSRRFYDGADEGFAAWKSSTGQDVHSKIADPLFINPGSSDFHLQSSSPAIDAGANVGLTADFEGAPVPQGVAPDIGAFEYASGEPQYRKSDLNQDNSINVIDLGILMSDFGKSAAQALNPKSDINSDGAVNVTDLGIMMSEWS